MLGIMAENNNIPQFVNSDSFMADKNYVKWLSDLKKRFPGPTCMISNGGLRSIQVK